MHRPALIVLALCLLPSVATAQEATPAWDVDAYAAEFEVDEIDPEEADPDDPTLTFLEAPALPDDPALLPAAPGSADVETRSIFRRKRRSSDTETDISAEANSRQIAVLTLPASERIAPDGQAAAAWRTCSGIFSTGVQTITNSACWTPAARLVSA